jgi:hypothetical protein
MMRRQVLNKTGLPWLALSPQLAEVFRGGLFFYFEHLVLFTPCLYNVFVEYK